MRELQIENKQSVWKIICNFFKKMFTTNKKIVIRSKCKESCCCKNCNCIVGYSEKSDDNSEEDIYITDDNVKIS